MDGFPMSTPRQHLTCLQETRVPARGASFFAATSFRPISSDHASQRGAQWEPSPVQRHSYQLPYFAAPSRRCLAGSLTNAHNNAVNFLSQATATFTIFHWTFLAPGPAFLTFCSSRVAGRAFDHAYSNTISMKSGSSVTLRVSRATPNPPNHSSLLAFA